MSEVNRNMESRCKCCLKNGGFKDMWAEYFTNGEVEIYGDMLNECFQFNWEKPDEYLELICEGCITKLKMSLDFRRDILSSEGALAVLLQAHSQDDKSLLRTRSVAFESDVVKEEYEYQEESQETGTITSEVVDKEEPETETEAEYIICDVDDDNDCQSPASGMEIEYLDDEVINPDSNTSKRGKKKSRYKNYTPKDLKEALRLVMSGEMTRADAAERYNIPLKTIGFKIRALGGEGTHWNEQDTGETLKDQFHDEIRTILTYTNATPYKTKVGRLFCAYCSTEGPIFETPESLRTHTRTVHCNDRLRKVEVFMRPNYLNEVVKMDIDNLLCTVCMVTIENWNGMFDHLREKHDIELDFAYTRVIPYVLDEDVFCCLCKEKFSHFHLLDVHMNNHYSNYICGECGDTFLSESRLKKHVETHSTKKYPCTLCGKVFTLEKYRKKHFDGVHLKELKFKCIYCQEVFSQDYTRHLHTLEKHPEKVKTVHCDYCELSFTWRPYYLKHMRLNHTQIEKKFCCKLCPKKFRIKSELKHHEEWHSGKGYTCHVCQRKFSSKNYLQKHSAVHSETVVESNTETQSTVTEIELAPVEIQTLEYTENQTNNKQE